MWCIVGLDLIDDDDGLRVVRGNSCGGNFLGAIFGSALLFEWHKPNVRVD
jgi:hypothetical protein